MENKSLIRRMWEIPAAVKALYVLALYFLGSTVYVLIINYAVKHLHSRNFYHQIDGGIMQVLRILVFVVFFIDISMRARRSRLLYAWMTMLISITATVVVVLLLCGWERMSHIGSGIYSLVTMLALMLFLLATSLLLFFSKGAREWFVRSPEEIRRPFGKKP
ncbi:hypothetical protein KKF84_16905 [Myxococcota bacterium]|nr:hypothetical protein [Myxococcota bacterium]